MVEQHQGTDLTFNNLEDLNVARGVVSDFTIPACVIVKHGAPAGMSISGDAASAFRRALESDPRSVYGGVIAINRTVNAETARVIADHWFDVIFAPDYSEDAKAIFAERLPDMRVLQDNERRTKSPGERDMRRVIGGMLVQDMDSEHVDRDFMDVPTAVTRERAAVGRHALRVACWQVGALERDRARQGPDHGRYWWRNAEPARGHRLRPRQGWRACARVDDGERCLPRL